MSNLVESIVNRELVSAKAMFEARMEEIRDQKLYEAKRCLGAQLDEIMGGKDIAALRAKGYQRASDVLGPSPYDKRKIGGVKQPKVQQAKPAKPSPAKKAKKKKGKPAKAPKHKYKPSISLPGKKSEKRPGIIKRNWNTLMGREADYKASPSKGGRLGKAIRGTVVGVKRGLEMLGQTGGGVTEE
ncbi:hypothetical protein EB001_16990 [bacterium]|nr:hypothetical protein [bacterium]